MELKSKCFAYKKLKKMHEGLVLGGYKMFAYKTYSKEHTTQTGLMFPALDLVKAPKAR